MNGSEMIPPSMDMQMESNQGSESQQEYVLDVSHTQAQLRVSHQPDTDVFGL